MLKRLAVACRRQTVLADGSRCLCHLLEAFSKHARSIYNLAWLRDAIFPSTRLNGRLSFFLPSLSPVACPGRGVGYNAGTIG